MHFGVGQQIGVDQQIKTIGLLGGLGWPSTVQYYRIINAAVEARTDHTDNAQILVNSVNGYEVIRLLKREDYVGLADFLSAGARRLESAGAEFIVMACNSAHVVADAIANATQVPFIHIADVVAREIARLHVRTVGLLSTTYTRQHAIYDRRFRNQGISIIYPSWDESRLLNEIIYNELRVNVMQRTDAVCNMANGLIRAGAQVIVLACTELSLAVDAMSFDVPVVDSATVHANVAARLSLGFVGKGV